MPVDTRFFEALGPATVGKIADLTGSEATGDRAAVITGISSAGEARGGDLCFHEGKPVSASEVSAAATACFVTEASAAHLPSGVIALVTAMPRWAHIQAAHGLFRVRDWNDTGRAPQIHPTARIGQAAVICAGVAIGADASIGPNCVIGPGVQIGRGTVIGANASIQCSLIGNDVTILSGARLGESGFGVTAAPDGAVDVPQWGRVIVQDHCLIGANTCIDRGAFADTIIGERTKIDNLCHIGHNSVLGRNVIMAGFSGISGSVTVRDGVVMGARSGIADHVVIGTGAQLAAGSGTFRDIPDGETWGGVPSKPLRQYIREVAWLQKQVNPKKKSAE